jgi:flagellar export protein FliJ
VSGSRRVHRDDRALAAVRRVREAREQDARIGLQHALAVVREREQQATAATARLETAPAFASGGPGELIQHQRRLASLARLQGIATGQAQSSRTVADEARRRWQQQRQDLRVVELLLERRAQTRREEQARADGRALDEVASQRWLRGSGAGGTGSTGGVRGGAR